MKFAMLIAVIASAVPLTAYAAKVGPAASVCVNAEDPAGCVYQFNEFQLALPKASHGDYMAQRQVAFCYASGCHGAMAVDLVKACTWQTVIVSTARSDNTDNFNFRQQCQQLNATDRNLASNAALSLYGKIYKKLMTKPLPYEAAVQP